MSSFTRDVFLNFLPRTKEVPLPERNGSTFVRELKVSEVIQFSKDQAGPNPADAVYNVILLATTDQAGTPVFTAEDKEAIKSLPYQVSNTILDAILEISGMTEDAKKKQPGLSNDAGKSDATTVSDSK